MDETPPQPHPPPTRPGWWSRNWKWFVPTGCLGLILLCVAFVGVLVFVVFGALKSTDIYKDAVAQAKANPEVIEALGSRIEEGTFLSGDTKVNGAAGSSSLAIPISGPKGKATIYVEATKSARQWNYSQLVVEIAETKQRIKLVEGAPVAEDEE